MIILTEVMDALADACIPLVTKNAYPWPVESINAPCVVIGYPTDLGFDYTFDRGSDRAIFPVYYMAGRTSDRNTRDELSRAIVGINGIKDAIDGTLGGTVSSATVIDCEVATVTVNSISYIALQFNVEIIS